MTTKIDGPKNMFRSNGSKYVTKLIAHISKDGSGLARMVSQGGFVNVIVAFEIFDEFGEEPLGAVMFTVAPLVSAVSKFSEKPFKGHYKSIDETAEVFTNLLSYLPFDIDKINPSYRGHQIYEYRFDSNFPDGSHDKLGRYMINTTGGIDKTIKRLVLGDNPSTTKIIESMKEALYCKYYLNQDVGISKNVFCKMVGVHLPPVQTNMRILVNSGLAEPTSESSTEGIISIKATDALRKEIEGGDEKPMSQDNRKYITIHGGVSAKGGSAINISVEGDIQQEFESVEHSVDNIDGLSNTQKREVKGLIQELNKEMAGKKDENKIVGILKKIGSISKQAIQKLTDNSTLAPFLTYYLAKTAGIPLP